MQPDLVLVGDSHVTALHAAAEAQGLTAAMLFISGNRWHDNLIRTHPRKGLSADHRPRLAKKVNAFAGSLGGTAFPEGVPILASIGYHLGRLVPPLARYGHTPDAAQAGADPDRLPISGAFLDAYIDTHRSRLFRLLRLAGQRSDLTVIAPPIIQSTWIMELLPPCAAICSGVRLAPSRKHLE